MFNAFFRILLAFLILLISMVVGYQIVSVFIPKPEETKVAEKPLDIKPLSRPQSPLIKEPSVKFQNKPKKKQKKQTKKARKTSRKKKRNPKYRKKLNSQLKKKDKNRLLAIPVGDASLPKRPAPKTKREKGRREREKLPLGVVLWDNVNVYDSEHGRKVIYILMTGDFVRVFKTSPLANRRHIQPGVDLYLAATSKKFEAAGNLLPDRDGWVDPTFIQIFNPGQAVEFTRTTEPMTLGPNSNYSTVDFYERAMKNPDPVVHRVVGPRIIELLSLHEDYVSTWGKLYRDYDSKIRSVTLSQLKKRGVAHNRIIIEDLIKRLSELTQEKLKGEALAEAMSILAILDDSGHERVPVALKGFQGTWKGSQPPTFTKRVDQMVKKG